MMKKMKSKKGFTLVEIVVVLVILAILAAIAIPAYTGYIDKANQRAVIAEARSVLVAAQTIASEAYGSGKLATADLGNMATDITTLSETTGKFTVTITAGKVALLVFSSSNGYTVTYTGAIAAVGATAAVPASWGPPAKGTTVTSSAVTVVSP